MLNELWLRLKALLLRKEFDRDWKMRSRSIWR